MFLVLQTTLQAMCVYRYMYDYVNSPMTKLGHFILYKVVYHVYTTHYRLMATTAALQI